MHTTVHGAWFAGECWFTWPEEIADWFPTQKFARKKKLGNKLRGWFSKDPKKHQQCSNKSVLISIHFLYHNPSCSIYELLVATTTKATATVVSSNSLVLVSFSTQVCLKLFPVFLQFSFCSKSFIPILRFSQKTFLFSFLHTFICCICENKWLNSGYSHKSCSSWMLGVRCFAVWLLWDFKQFFVAPGENSRVSELQLSNFRERASVNCVSHGCWVAFEFACCEICTVACAKYCRARRIVAWVDKPISMFGKIFCYFVYT